MDPLPPPKVAPRARARRIAVPLVAGAFAWLIALAALLHGTRGEAEARRSLLLRSGEVVGWLARDVAASCERAGTSEPGGAADAAPAWRDVLGALEESIALSLAGPPRLPSLAADARLAESLKAALGARRFTPFTRPDEIVEDPWSRRVAVFASLLANGCSAPAERGEWLDAAVALVSDLRSVGTLAYAVAAAGLEDAVAKRLQDDAPLPSADVQRLVERLRAALRRLPRPECAALRETRVLQATVCALADVAPLDGARLRSENEPAVALVSADDAVARLDRLPGLLFPRLSIDAGPRAATDWNAFVDDFSHRLPRLATVLPSEDEIEAAATAATRLGHLLELAGARAPDGAAR
jgi:hypothetical protein